MENGRRAFFLLFFLLCSRQPSPNIEAILICSLFPDFTPRQTSLCKDNPQVVAAISKGVNTGLKECEYQFRNHRWNCSSTKDKSSFGKTRAVPGTREASFTSAVVAAGVAYAVTRECTKGNISSCSCSKRNDHGRTTQVRWKWGGCSDDIDYGIQMSNEFLDVSRELSNKSYELQNKHNSNTGRKVIQESFKTDCLCHGPCGSCSYKTCWKSLSLFRQVGNTLKQKYNSAIRVKPVIIKSYRGPVPKNLVVAGTNFEKPSAEKSVYLRKAPNYCKSIPDLGVPGTSGRTCDYLSKDTNGCEHLCCGRGYNKIESVIETECFCRFYWCCRVQCKICKKTIQATICK